MTRTDNTTPGEWLSDMDVHEEPYLEVQIKSGTRVITSMWIDDAPEPEFNAQQHANAHLISASKDLRRELEAVEWSDGYADDREWINMCPKCQWNEPDGHAPGCTLAAALAKSYGEAK